MTTNPLDYNGRSRVFKIFSAIVLVLFAAVWVVPLLFAGIALVHGLVDKGGLARFWLVGMYITLLLFMQLIYPLLVVLAIVDSLFDFRGRLARKNGPGSANGEG